MRLKDNVDTAVVAVASGAEGGANFGRVVSVVVDHCDAAHRALHLKAPVDAAKILYALDDGLGFDLQLVGNSHGGGGVEDVVGSGDMQLEGSEHAAIAGGNLEAGTHSFDGRQHTQDIVGAGIGSVGEDLSANAHQDGGKLRIVEAGDAGAVKGHAIQELDEGILHVGHVAVAIHVLAIEVSDYCENGRQLQEGAVAL